MFFSVRTKNVEGQDRINHPVWCRIFTSSNITAQRRVSLSVLGSEVDKTAESDFLQKYYSGVKGRATSHKGFFGEMIFFLFQWSDFCSLFFFVKQKHFHQGEERRSFSSIFQTEQLQCLLWTEFPTRLKWDLKVKTCDFLPNHVFINCFLVIIQNIFLNSKTCASRVSIVYCSYKAVAITLQWPFKVKFSCYFFTQSKTSFSKMLGLKVFVLPVILLKICLPNKIHYEVVESISEGAQNWKLLLPFWPGHWSCQLQLWSHSSLGNLLPPGTNPGYCWNR